MFFKYTESGLSEVTSLKSPLLSSYGFKHFRKEKIYVRGLDRDRKYFRPGGRLVIGMKEIEASKSMARFWFGWLGRL